MGSQKNVNCDSSPPSKFMPSFPQYQHPVPIQIVYVASMSPSFLISDSSRVKTLPVFVLLYLYPLLWYRVIDQWVFDTRPFGFSI